MNPRGELAHAIRNPLAAADANLRFVAELCGDLRALLRDVPEGQLPKSWNRKDPVALLNEVSEALSDSSEAGARADSRSTRALDRGRTLSATILIVDDEEHVTAALRRSLSGQGYRILLAHTRQEAMDHLRREPVRAILSDVAMPETRDPRDVTWLDEADAWSPGAARILITAWPEALSTARLREARIDAVISKPWDLAELRGVIRSVCAPGRSAV